MFRRSLRLKIIALVLATTVAALTFIGAVLVIHGVREHRASWAADLDTQAELVGLATAPALAFHDTLAARQNLGLLSVRPQIAAAAIYGPTGAPVATYIRQGEPAHDFPPPPNARIRVRGNLVEVFHPIADADERLGWVYVASRYDWATTVTNYLLVVLLAMAGSLIVALVMSAMLQSSVTDPILSIAAVARRVGAERDYALRVPRTTQDETGELVDAFNDMLGEVGQRARALEGSNRALEREMEVRHDAERALRESNHRKDEFIATLAHELRNPLAPIRNALHYLRLKVSADPEEARMLELMERQLQHMVRLIEDLMDIARVTHDALDLRPTTFRLAGLLDYVVESCEYAIRGGAHDFQLHAPREPIVLRADRARLAQVMCNLVQNAAKYTPRGGRIELSAERDDGALVVTVTDNGIGIPAAKLDAVFEPFAQLDRSLEKTAGGLGIGLALARRLVMLHGGTITADSPGPGLGSTFRIRLPVIADGATAVELGEDVDASPSSRAASAVASVPASAGVVSRAAADGRRRRVLVADDNADAVETLAHILRAAGFDVETAADGEAALELASTGSFEAAVLDIGMPRLNGHALARRIRQEPWGRSMRLLALTGWGQEEDRERARAAGFDAHLTKPVLPERLVEVLLGTERDPGAADTGASANPTDPDPAASPPAPPEEPAPRG